MNHSKKQTGQCLCGSVKFEIQQLIRSVINCHCTMCLRLHGTFGAHSKAYNKDITFTEEKGLKWYKSSSFAERGFCQDCGSSLFWRPIGGTTSGIVAGSIDDSSALKTTAHIFVDSKAAFYEITDDLPQYPETSTGLIKDDLL